MMVLHLKKNPSKIIWIAVSFCILLCMICLTTVCYISKFELFKKECPIHIEVYTNENNTPTFEYLTQSKIYGSYSKFNLFNGRNKYKSDFENGKFNIWWTGYSWIIGNDSMKWQLGGFAVSYMDKKCIDKTYFTWKYYTGKQMNELSNSTLLIYNRKIWKNAGKSLGIRKFFFNS